MEGTEKDDDDDGDDVVDGDNVGVMIVATKYPEKIGPKPRPRASPVPTMAFIDARSVIFVMEAFIPIVVWPSYTPPNILIPPKTIPQ